MSVDKTMPDSQLSRFSLSMAFAEHFSAVSMPNSALQNRDSLFADFYCLPVDLLAERCLPNEYETKQRDELMRNFFLGT